MATSKVDNTFNRTLLAGLALVTVGGVLAARWQAGRKVASGKQKPQKKKPEKDPVPVRLAVPSGLGAGFWSFTAHLPVDAQYANHPLRMQASEWRGMIVQAVMVKGVQLVHYHLCSATGVLHLVTTRPEKDTMGAVAGLVMIAQKKEPVSD